MAERAKRRRLNPQSEEINRWNGFCEIESEPALFNVMLREFGVQGVRVQEVVSLDDEMMAFLHKPVYGLIFLFRWREDDPGKQEATCPEGLWFANQTASNACASVALLNIVNNIEGIELGDNLQCFKDFTRSFTPAQRGDAINNFEFIKRRHNLFARKMDVLNSDLQLRNDATSRRRSTKHTRDDYESDAGFHFIAFVPAMGKVWKFDGLERQPQALGDCPQNDWLGLAKPDILARMTEYEEDQIEFSILSLVKDPLLGLIDQFAVNVRSLEIVNGRIAAMEDKMDSETAAVNISEENVTLGPDESYSLIDGSYPLTRDAIDKADIPVSQKEIYETCPVDELKQHRQSLSNAQQVIRATFREEERSQQADEEYAASRQYDYGTIVKKWVQFMARKRGIENLAV